MSPVAPGSAAGEDGDRPAEGGSPDHGRRPDLSTGQLLAGRYSTETLVAAAEILRAAGWSRARVRREVYAPFIVVGPASWGDSWHAPRFGPGSLVRQHEGQDVLCRYGSEVLAPEDGTVEFGTSLLGGRSARVVRPDGGFYYFAHFVDWNDRVLSSGDEVRRGDVIGFCGDTGNATVAHVHFSWYGADGAAIDPMRRLIGWLREAEARLPTVLQSASLDLTRSPIVRTPWYLRPSTGVPADGSLDVRASGAVLPSAPLAAGPGLALELTALLFIGVIATVFGLASVLGSRGSMVRARVSGVSERPRWSLGRSEAGSRWR